MRHVVVGVLLVGVFSGFTDCDACDPNKPGASCSQSEPCTSGLYCGADGTCKAQTPPYLYATDKIAKRLSFEIDYVQGQLPNQASIDAMLQRLREMHGSGHVKKPEGVEYLVDDTVPAHADPNHAYTFEELQNMVNGNKNTRSNGRYASAYVLYVDGHSADDNGASKVLGFAYDSDKIVIFKKTITEVCENNGGLFAADICRLTEASVLMHEFGHLLGLVNNGMSMHAAHQDAAHAGHDVNDQCLMYWAIETDSGVSMLLNRLLGGNSSLPSFDAACLQDLADAQTVQ